MWWHVQLREFSWYFSVIILHYFRLKKNPTYVNACDSWSILYNFSHVKNITLRDVKLIFCFVHFLNFRAKKKTNMTLVNLKIGADDFYFSDDMFIFSQYFSEIILHYFRLKKFYLRKWPFLWLMSHETFRTILVRDQKFKHLQQKITKCNLFWVRKFKINIPFLGFL